MESSPTQPSHLSWFVYIVECADGTYYTGCTPNVEHRLAAHNAGTGARYTKVHRPVHLVYLEMVANRSQAQQREHEIKQLTHQQKHALIQPQLVDISSPATTASIH